METTTHPRLDEEAGRLLREAARLLDAGESVLANALLEDTHDEFVMAAAHAVVCSSKARRLLSVATHTDLERVA